MTIDIKLRDEDHIKAFTEAKLLAMVVHGETELSNTDFVARLIEAYTAFYEFEAGKIEEARTYDTGPDARDEEEDDGGW